MTIFSKYLRHLADNQRADSLSTSLRKKRFDLFEAFVDEYCSSNPPCPLKIIDVGRTPVLWDKAFLFDRKPLTGLKSKLRSPILNLSKQNIHTSNVSFVMQRRSIYE